MAISGIFITNDSFTGNYALARAINTDPELQSYIDKYERKYILRLLGVELGKLLIAYKESQPNSDPPIERYDDLIAPFDLQETGNNFCHHKIHSSLGIEDMLTAFIFYHYVSQTQLKPSQSGMVKTETEVSNVVSPQAAARSAEQKWNAALETSEAIQWFCRWKEDDTTHEKIYPEYAGIKFNPQYGSML